MKELRELQKRIEAARLDLNHSYDTDCFEVYYKKSVELDQLIERYLDAKETMEIKG